MTRVQSSINLDGEDEEDDDNDEENGEFTDFTTLYMACFILFGPYRRKWGQEIVELFSVDTAAIDARAKKVKIEKKKCIEIDIDPTRDIRGNFLMYFQTIIESETCLVVSMYQFDLLF